MVNYWRLVNKVINEADLLLLVLDARLIKETRNKEIERKIIDSEKPLIYVINKCDLVKEEDLRKYKQRIRNSVFISSKDKTGLKSLQEKIHIYSSKIKKEHFSNKINVGVLGYPNVGKSSLINAMKGKKSAKTSALSGYTKALQKIKTDKKIVMIDTPGVIPYKETDDLKHSLTGTIDFTKIKEPDSIVFEMMEKFPGKIENYYDIKINEDFEETIEKIALKKKILIKGGLPDTKRMSRMIITQWQSGKIN
ncbi:MAG: GTPase [Candidatus Woesearchaeota archaeon]